jgi:hypothetical protein
MARANGSPHVVELYDAGILPGGRRYLALEWVEGENLEELLDYLRNQDQRMSIVRACRIGRGVAQGLAELHEHGVLHLRCDEEGGHGTTSAPAWSNSSSAVTRSCPSMSVSGSPGSQSATRIPVASSVRWKSPAA